MLRALFRLLGGLLLVGAAAAGLFLWRSPDAGYEAREWVFRERYHRYDDLIREVGRRHQVDPALVKAVIWRESRFRPAKEGLAGERGLMQITMAAANEWARDARIRAFLPGDLFDPKTNVEVGTWLLARALQRYQDRDNPVTYALAEYNAGRSRVQRWMAGPEAASGAAGAPGAANGPGPPPAAPAGGGGGNLPARISFPGTRQYVETVEARFRFYQRRGRL